MSDKSEAIRYAAELGISADELQATHDDLGWSWARIHDRINVQHATMTAYVYGGESPPEYYDYLDWDEVPTWAEYYHPASS